MRCVGLARSCQSAQSRHGWSSRAPSRSGASSSASSRAHVLLERRRARRRDAARPRRRRARAAASRRSVSLPPLYQRKPATTQSAVRWCLIFDITRLPGVYASVSGFAITPSRPAPSKRSNQSAATARSRVAGVTWIGGLTPASARSSRVAALGLRPRAQVLVADREQVPRDVRRRDARREHLRRATPPGGSAAASPRSRAGRRVRDHDLAVEHAALGQVRAQRRPRARGSSGRAA